jgi:hypothetical protein
MAKDKATRDAAWQELDRRQPPPESKAEAPAAAEVKPDLSSKTVSELHADANMAKDKATRDAAWQELDRRQHPPETPPAAEAEKAVTEKTTSPATEGARKVEVSLPPERAAEMLDKAIAEVAQATDTTAKGAVNIGAVKDKLKEVYTAAKEYKDKAVERVKDNVALACQRMAPHIGRYNPEARDAFAEALGARATGVPWGNYVATQAYPNTGRKFYQNHIDLEMDKKLAAMRNEEVFRYDRAKALADGRTEDADKIGTVIGNKSGVFKTNEEYEAAWQDPEVIAALQRLKEVAGPELDAQYRAAEGLDADQTLPDNMGRFPVHISSMAVEADSPGAISVHGVASQGKDVRGVFLKGSPFARSRTSAGDFYSGSLSQMMGNQYGKNGAVASFNRYVAALTDKGDAFIGTSKAMQDHGQLNGHAAVAVGVEGPGRTFLPIDEKGDFDFDKAFSQGKKLLFLREDMTREHLQAFGLGVDPQDIGLKAWADVTNKAMVTGMAEPAGHVANQTSTAIVQGQFLHPMNIVRAMVGQHLNDPEILKTLVDIGKEGGLRNAHQGEPGVGGGMLTGSTIRNISSAVLMTTDKTVRILSQQLAERKWAAMEAKGKTPDISKEEFSRRYVLATGQYNARAQHPWMAALRASALSTFITAGVNFGTLPVRAMKMKTAWVTAGTLLGTAAVYNYEKWGRADGADGVPVGAVYTGPGVDKEGKPTVTYWNLFAFHPFSRLLRETGGNQVIEHFQETSVHGADPETLGQRADAAARDSIESWLSPMWGPPVRAAQTLITGYGDPAFQYRMSPHVKKGESQMAANAKAMAENLVPSIGHYLSGKGSYFGKWGEQERRLPKAASSDVPGAPKAALKLPKIKMP